MVDKFLKCQEDLTYKAIIINKYTKKQKRLINQIDFLVRGGIIIGGVFLLILFTIYQNWIWIIIFFLFQFVYIICMMRVANKIYNYTNYFILSRHYREFKFQRPISGVRIRLLNYKLIRKVIFLKKCQNKDIANKRFLYDLCIIVKPRIIELTTRNYHNTFMLIAISLVIGTLFSLLFILVQGNKDKIIMTVISSFLVLYLGFVGDQISKNRLSKFSRKYKELIEIINEIIDK